MDHLYNSDRTTQSEIERMSEMFNQVNILHMDTSVLVRQSPAIRGHTNKYIRIFQTQTMLSGNA